MPCKFFLKVLHISLTHLTPPHIIRSTSQHNVKMTLYERKVEDGWRECAWILATLAVSVMCCVAWPGQPSVTTQLLVVLVRVYNILSSSQSQQTSRQTSATYCSKRRNIDKCDTFHFQRMASPRTRRVLAELRPKDDNNVS